MAVSIKAPKACSANKAKAAEVTEATKVCSARGKSYCLIHRRYYETSWCPDCDRVNGKKIYRIPICTQIRSLSYAHTSFIHLPF
ncbi:hypothetical protein J3Q64DRAFT_1647339 [Phycomyces blakesleeanus]|uniref:Uncharacterized protein n=2 Tax=Phycomyces blakesleeanus TaxID=4837 RepID=A0A162PL69_PHYB8|nr:hypothetical protein PHYBLDRAFT_159726 [Phycomyces blakesleeanus NRRL 1555(-)]OAD69946.1 hypothetical protein PHYBLDRAFT_159726 [Phycomyces blakesleeanus NRRL 1555(-)]|eukprot:XP_018287986.1 hypothetical protein PHYBLDRAFT_159726 [Phycomyces blakesleeanus NRRL 1555(-)]